MSWVWSGPMVSASLADLGADVIKPENPARPDSYRVRGRPMRNGVPVDGPVEELFLPFHQNNRGKRSILLDIKDPAGADVFRRLVRESDVVIEYLTPGVFDRAGIGYNDVISENPRLIWLAASAVGSTGPLVGMRDYAPIMTALAGVEGLVGYEDDPVVGMIGVGIGDANAGSHALYAVLAALVARQRDGRGRFIDMSQIEAAAAILIEPLVEAQLQGKEPRASGVSHPDVAPHGHYPCSEPDIWVAIAAVDDAMWRRLASVVGGRQLGGDKRFVTVADRLQRSAEIDEIILGWTATRSREAVLTSLALCDVSATSVLSVGDARGIFDAHLVEVRHPITGVETLVRTPWSLSETPPAIPRAAPLLGEHTEEILRDILGMDESEIRHYTSWFKEFPRTTRPNPSED